MTENLMDTVKSQITPEAIEKAAASTGESPENTRTAMHGAVSAVFAGLVRSASTRGGSERILGALGQGGVSGFAGRMAGSIGAESSAGEGQGLMSRIFGDRTGAVSTALAESAGIKSGSASHLLAFVSPLVAGVVGKEIASRHLDAGGVSRLLLDHKRAVVEDPATPRGLAGALGIGALSEMGGQEAAEARGPTPAAEAEARSTPAQPSSAQPSSSALGRVKERMVEGRERIQERALEARERIQEPALREPAREAHEGVSERALETRESARESVDPSRRRRSRAIWLPALLFGLLAVWGIFALMGNRGPTGVTAPQATVPTLRTPELPKAPQLPGGPEVQGPSAAGSEQPSPAGSEQIAPPGGTATGLGKSGPAADLARSLSESSEALPHTFQFDALTFETGSATLSGPEATKTIDQMASLLQAHPDARIRIVGHTDNQGDPKVNEELSASRADAVKQMLVNRGVADDRVETAGKSDSEAVAGNDTDEGRARNRRVDVVLVSR